LFAYDRFDDIEVGREKRTVQQYLVIEQAGVAMDIFKYIKDTESLLEAHEVILKNIPPTENAERLDYMKSMASCCVKNGRTEQAIAIYQKALKICALANLGE
jgi:pentatricopeptide repeat protein